MSKTTDVFTGGRTYLEWLRDIRPEFANLPDELIPWPWRADDTPPPAFCPKCGRAVIHYWWANVPRYHEVACASWLNGLLRYFPGALFLLHHWQIGVGADDEPPSRRRRWHRFDVLSGEPMDGPR